MNKICEEHGEFNILIEKDAGFYKMLMNRHYNKRRINFETLRLPITSKCRLNCHFCFNPYKNEDRPIEFLKNIISTQGIKRIKLSGGEPTERKELIELIKYAQSLNKTIILCTNGIKCSDEDYVRKLKNAGLNHVRIP